MKNKTNYLLTLIGIVLLGVGLYLIKTQNAMEGLMLTLPYVCVGLGCGIFGHGMGNFISSRTLKNHPDERKQLEIEQKDERNIAIANRAKAKAYDIMTFIFGALMISFALMGIELAAVLLLVFAYLLVHGFGIYYRLKYEKEM